jgi:adenylate kinase family enzyme
LLEGRRRILVIGPSGAGKSTLARRLGAITGLPVIHLDRVYWNAGWVPTPDEEFRSRLAALLREPEWIIDGAYVTTQEERLSYSDAVVFLDFPPRVYRYRVLKRIASTYGRARPDLAPGCPEKLDWEFLRWVWRWHHDIRPDVLRRLGGAREKLVTLTTGLEVDRFMAAVADGHRRAS